MNARPKLARITAIIRILPATKRVMNKVVHQPQERRVPAASHATRPQPELVRKLVRKHMPTAQQPNPAAATRTTRIIP